MHLVLWESDTYIGGRIRRLRLVCLASRTNEPTLEVCVGRSLVGQRWVELQHIEPEKRAIIVSYIIKMYPITYQETLVCPNVSCLPRGCSCD